MKQYIVNFSEPVCHKYIGDKFNRELKNGNLMLNVKSGMIHLHFILLFLQRNSLKLISANTKDLASQKHGLMVIGRI